MRSQVMYGAIGLTVVVVAYFALQHGLFIRERTAGAAAAAAAVGAGTGGSSSTGWSQLASQPTAPEITASTVRDWLRRMSVSEREKAITSLCKGHTQHRPDVLVSRPAKPKIALYWDGDHNGGMWPMDAPRVWADLASYNCRANCDFVDVTGSEGNLQSADAVVFNGEWVEQLGPQDYISKYGGKKEYQSFWMMVMHADANHPKQAVADYTRHMDYYMSLDQNSEVPITHAYRTWLNSYYMLHDKREDADAFIMRSNCESNNARSEWIPVLSKLLRTHSYGKCDNNREWTDEGKDSRAKLALMSTYKLCLAFENTNQKNYVTETLYHALAAGCVPVYMGAPNIDEFLPAKKCIVKASDFKNAAELGKFLQNLLADPAEYASYLEWKKPVAVHQPQAESVGSSNSNNNKNNKKASPPKRVGEDKIAELQFHSALTAPCRICEFLRGVNSDRTPQEMRQMYEAVVHHAVTHPNYQFSHDKKGLEGVFDASNSDLAFPLPAEEEMQIRQRREEDIEKEKMVRAARAKAEEEKRKREEANNKPN